MYIDLTYQTSITKLSHATYSPMIYRNMNTLQVMGEGSRCKHMISKPCHEIYGGKEV